MRNLNARVSDPNEFTTCPGEKMHPIFSAKLMDDGTILLKKTDEEDIQAKIDSYRDQTDMAYVLRQLMLGDTSVLTQKEPMYGDFTQMPKNMMEAMQLMIDGEKAFYELDLETRQRFDNNFRQWIIDAGSPEWCKKMNLNVDPAPATVAESEVKTDV